jgi:hypothetical protein
MMFEHEDTSPESSRHEQESDHQSHSASPAKLMQQHASQSGSDGGPLPLCSPDLSGIFEQRLSDICGSIADVETRCSASEARANAAEERAEEAELQALDCEERCD